MKHFNSYVKLKRLVQVMVILLSFMLIGVITGTIIAKTHPDEDANADTHFVYIYYYDKDQSLLLRYDNLGLMPSGYTADTPSIPGFQTEDGSRKWKYSGETEVKDVKTSSSYMNEVQTYASYNHYRFYYYKEVFTITYDYSPVKGPIAGLGEAEKLYGEDFTVSSVKPKRTGYEFKGWRWRENSSSPWQYVTNNKLTRNANTTLCAIWEQITYNITYEKNLPSSMPQNDITSWPSNQTRTHGGSAITIAEPTVKDSSQYTFLGWSTYSSAKKPNRTYDPGKSYSTNSDLKLYAVWSNTYTITFKVINQDDGYSEDTTGNIGRFQVDGKDVTSIKVARDGTTLSSRGYNYTHNYTENSITITDGQTGESIVVEAVHGYHCYFLKWASNASGTDLTINSITGDTTIYGIFGELPTYNIVYNADGGVFYNIDTGEIIGESFVGASWTWDDIYGSEILETPNVTIGCLKTSDIKFYSGINGLPNTSLTARFKVLNSWTVRDADRWQWYEGGSRYNRDQGGGTFYLYWTYQFEDFEFPTFTADDDDYLRDFGLTHEDFLGWYTSPDPYEEWAHRLGSVEDLNWLLDSGDYDSYNGNLYARWNYSTNYGDYKVEIVGRNFEFIEGQNQYIFTYSPNIIVSDNTLYIGDQTVKVMPSDGYTFLGFDVPSLFSYSGYYLKKITVKTAQIGNYDIHITGSNFTFISGTSDYHFGYRPTISNTSYYSLKIDENITVSVQADGGYTLKGFEIPNDFTETDGGYVMNIVVKTVAVYTITYNANGGTGSMSSQTVEAGDMVTLRTNRFTRTGYRFAGWSTNADAGPYEFEYSDGARIGIVQNLELFAIWEELFTVTFEVSPGDCGSINVDTISNVPKGSYVEVSGRTITIIGTSVTVSLTPNDEYNEYTFINWTVDGDEVTTDYQIEADITIVANINRTEFITIKYNKNTTDEVTGMPSNVRTEKGGDEPILTTGITRAGYTFLGWDESATAINATYLADTECSTTDTIYLYAIWGVTLTVKPYTIESGSVTVTATKKVGAADVEAISGSEQFKLSIDTVITKSATGGNTYTLEFTDVNGDNIKLTYTLSANTHYIQMSKQVTGEALGNISLTETSITIPKITDINIVVKEKIYNVHN